MVFNNIVASVGYIYKCICFCKMFCVTVFWIKYVCNTVLWKMHYFDVFSYRITCTISVQETCDIIHASTFLIMQVIHNLYWYSFPCTEDRCSSHECINSYIKGARQFICKRCIDNMHLLWATNTKQFQCQTVCVCFLP